MMPMPRLLLDMAMAVDAAGQHELAAGIDGSRAAQAGAHLGDLLAANADVGAKDFLRRGDGAATDH